MRRPGAAWIASILFFGGAARCIASSVVDEFEGYLGGRPQFNDDRLPDMYVSISYVTPEAEPYIVAPQGLKGVYFFRGGGRDTYFDGEITDKGQVVFYLADSSGSRKSFFTGTFVDQGRAGPISGVWSLPSGSKELYLGAYAEDIGGKLDTPYEQTDFGDATDKVDAFAAKFIDAVNKDDANAISKMVRYPLPAKLNKGKIYIQDATDFNDNYADLFKSIKKSILDTVPHRLPVMQGSVIIGGCVHVGACKPDGRDPCICSIDY
jgi:hypothetical protein